MSVLPPTSLPKRFDPGPAEARWYREWLARGVFRADPEDPRPAFSIVIPPPNVTGSLHLGHALNNTLQDLLCRHKRLEGYNVLWVPGTDHAGISTQVVVEREIAKQGRTRHDLGREAFVDRVWEWKAQYGARIVLQLQALGASCDWSRERFTMDPGLSRAVREVFVRLYHEGLIYRSEYLVSWCPRCSTVLSDLESPYKPVAGKLYRIRYPLADGDGAIEVETTRPETLLGDTAVAVHPDDERWQQFVGRHVRLPLLGREIPVVADSLRRPRVRDRRREDHARPRPERLRLRPPPGTARHQHPASGRDAERERRPLRRPRRWRTRASASWPISRRRACWRRTRDHPHEVPHCDRCETLVQPLLSEQWFMRMKPLADPAIAAVREGRIQFHPKTWENTYFHWMENIRDWAISRQLWWGHRIPAWKCAPVQRLDRDGGRPRSLRALRIGRDRRRRATCSTPGSPARSGPSPPSAGRTRRRSCAASIPTSVLSTAFDIIFFWVARMIMMGLHFMDEVPFRDVYIHPARARREGAEDVEVEGHRNRPAWT